jgi:hypothetical protein
MSSRRVIHFSHCIASLSIFCAAFLTSTEAQTTTVVPANLAASHVGEYVTVQGVVAKLFASKAGNTFLNIGAAYPNQTFTGWIPPASAVSKSPLLDGIEGKHVKITGRIEMYKRKAGNSDKRGLSARPNHQDRAAYSCMLPHRHLAHQIDALRKGKTDNHAEVDTVLQRKLSLCFEFPIARRP